MSHFSLPLVVVGLLLAFCLGVSASTVTPAPTHDTTSNATVAWRFTLPQAQIVVNPFASRELVFVPSNVSLFAFVLKTGVLLWTFEIPEGDTGGYVSAFGELVFLGTQTRVYGLDRYSGAVLWNVTVPGDSSPSRPNPEIHIRADACEGTGMVYCTSDNGPLTALDATTGALRFTVAGQAFDHVFFTGSRIYFMNRIPKGNGTTNVVVCADGYTGSPIWTSGGGVKNYLPSPGPGAVPLVYLRYSEGKVQTMVAVDDRTGKAVWTQSFPGIGATFDDVFSDGLFFTASSLRNDAYPNHLVCMNATTGQRLWHRIIGFFYLLAGEGAVFAFGTVTVVKAYSAADGHLLWVYDAVGVNDGIVAGGLVVFPTATEVIALVVNPSSPLERARNGIS